MNSLFFLVQLEFVYHADNWTVHLKLYERYFLLYSLWRFELRIKENVIMPVVKL